MRLSSLRPRFRVWEMSAAKRRRAHRYNQELIHVITHICFCFTLTFFIPLCFRLFMTPCPIQWMSCTGELRHTLWTWNVISPRCLQMFKWIILHVCLCISFCYCFCLTVNSKSSVFSNKFDQSWVCSTLASELTNMLMLFGNGKTVTVFYWSCFLFSVFHFGTGKTAVVSF